MNIAANSTAGIPAGTAATGRIKILCVDDDADVLASLAPNLRRRCNMLSATSGAEGLEILGANRDVAVVISDMRMPGMDGAAFLRDAREIAPDATRMVLTGQTDVATAIVAVNEGRIFRFLTKPCSPVDLLAAVDAAAEQHRLVTAERVLLEQTLHGSIKTLTDVLALTHPLAFGRARRVRQLVSELAEHLGLRERWQLEVAAMLSQLGAISLPAETVEKVYYGQVLDDDERQAIVRAATIAAQLLENIPRLEVVREMLNRLWGLQGVVDIPLIAQRALADLGGSILRSAVDFDVIEGQGHSPTVAIAWLCTQTGRHRPEVLEALKTLRGDGGAQGQVRECPLGAVRVGMVFAEDVKLASGAMLVPRGYEVTPSLIERVRTQRAAVARMLVRVMIKPPDAAPTPTPQRM